MGNSVMAISQRVFIEYKKLDGTCRIDKMEELKSLAGLLHDAGSTSEYRAMRCIGMTDTDFRSVDVALIFELPGWANPTAAPLSLEAALRERPQFPSLTERFSLAKGLITAVYHLHSTSWMHKGISSVNIIFFQNINNPASRAYDFHNPFLEGFTHARQNSVGGSRIYVGSDPIQSYRRSDRSKWKRAEFLSRVYRHPAYLLHKAVQEPGYLCHRFRHEYYALGLVLLEIGLWRSLEHIPIITQTLEEVGVFSDFHMDVVERPMLFFVDEAIVDTSSDKSIPVSVWYRHAAETIHSPAFPLAPMGVSWSSVHDRDEVSDLGRFFHDFLNTAVPEEDIQRQRARGLRRTWKELYIYELLRRDYIAHAEKELGNTMGEKYQKLVLRCLKGDFGLPPGAPESAWRHAFNWHVVREIEQCCV